jgi:hypothetical protein
LRPLIIVRDHFVERNFYLFTKCSILCNSHRRAFIFLTFNCISKWLIKEREFSTCYWSWLTEREADFTSWSWTSLLFALLLSLWGLLLLLSDFC